MALWSRDHTALEETLNSDPSTHTCCTTTHLSSAPGGAHTFALCKHLRAHKHNPHTHTQRERDIIKNSNKDIS